MIESVFKSKLLLLLIFLGLVIRLVLAPLDGFQYDMSAWFAWAIRLQDFNFAHFYSSEVWTNYTPGFLYILSIIGFLRNLLNLSDSSTYLIIKLPTIIAEIILSIFLYQQLSGHLYRKALISGLILLNIGLIFNSAIWGQIDGFLTLFLVLTVYYFGQKRFILAGLLFGLSLLIKPQSLALLPVFGIYFLRDFSLTKIAKFGLTALGFLLLTSLPFFPNNPIFGIFALIKQMTLDYPYNSLNAYNFWGMFGFWIPDDQSIYGISYQIWGFIIYFAFWLKILYFHSKSKLGLYTLASLATLSFFFLPTRSHERYLYPAIPFLLLSLRENYSRLKIYLVVLLSILYFLNLHYVYVYYNQISNQVPEIIHFPWLYSIEDAHKQFLSFASTLTFIVISYLLIFSKKEQKNNV